MVETEDVQYSGVWQAFKRMDLLLKLDFWNAFNQFTST